MNAESTQGYFCVSVVRVWKASTMRRRWSCWRRLRAAWSWWCATHPKSWRRWRLASRSSALPDAASSSSSSFSNSNNTTSTLNRTTQRRWGFSLLLGPQHTDSRGRCSYWGRTVIVFLFIVQHGLLRLPRKRGEWMFPLSSRGQHNCRDRTVTVRYCAAGGAKVTKKIYLMTINWLK